MNPESHDRSGYYWTLDGPGQVHCGMSPGAYLGNLDSCLSKKYSEVQLKI